MVAVVGERTNEYFRSFLPVSYLQYTQAIVVFSAVFPLFHFCCLHVIRNPTTQVNKKPMSRYYLISTYLLLYSSSIKIYIKYNSFRLRFRSRDTRYKYLSMYFLKKNSCFSALRGYQIDSIFARYRFYYFYLINQVLDRFKVRRAQNACFNIRQVVTRINTYTLHQQKSQHNISYNNSFKIDAKPSVCP